MFVLIIECTEYWPRLPYDLEHGTQVMFRTAYVREIRIYALRSIGHLLTLILSRR